MYSWISKQMNGKFQYLLKCKDLIRMSNDSVDWTGLSEIKIKIPTPKILRQDRLQTFWISWDQIKLGKPFNSSCSYYLSNVGRHVELFRTGRKKRNKPSIPVRDHNNRWLLSFGKGSHIGVRPLASIPLEIGDTPFGFIGFSTSWGFQGFFRVWGTDGAVDQTTRTLNVPKPTGNVKGERAEITVKGNKITFFVGKVIESLIMNNGWQVE